jgi:hypothetical protein
LAGIRLSIIDLGGVLAITHEWVIILHHLLAVSLSLLMPSSSLEDSRNLSLLAQSIPAVGRPAWVPLCLSYSLFSPDTMYTF